MKLVPCKDYFAMSTHAAGCMYRQAKRNPRSVFCVAWGQTPVATYKYFRELCIAHDLKTNELVFVQADEVHRLEDGHAASGYHALDDMLFRPLGVRQENIVRFRSDARDSYTECLRVADALKERGGLDMSVLGVGPNGHIAGNEPKSKWDTRGVHAEPIVPSSFKHMPDAKKAGVTVWLTLGLKDIVETKGKILVLISGRHKGPPLNELKKRIRSSLWPVTYPIDHAGFTVVYNEQSFVSK